MQASTPWNDVAFSFSERDRHLGIRPVSQLNTWPVVSPVNASRRPSRDVAHHSGSGRLATPYPVKDLHLLFFASLSWRTPRWVMCGRRPRVKGFFGFLLAVGCKSCVRPVCAVLMTAGPDVIRRSGPYQNLALDSA